MQQGRIMLLNQKLNDGNQWSTKDNHSDQFPYPAIASNESGTKKEKLLSSYYVVTTFIYLPKGPLYATECTANKKV